jgi:hypothetical protein
MKSSKNFLRNPVESLVNARSLLSRNYLLALGGAAAFFGGQTTTAFASTGHDATAGVTPQVVNTSTNFAEEIIEDYDSRKGNPNERSMIAGVGGLDVITVVYNAPDSITKKAGERVLVASVRKGPNGQPDPHRLIDEKIGVYSGTGSNTSSSPTFLYDVDPTVMEGQHAWSVRVNVDGNGKNNFYNYTTGTPFRGSTFALDAADFQALSSMASSTLNAAPHHAVIKEPVLPFPAPIVGIQ